MRGNTLTWVEKKIIEGKAKYNSSVVFIDHLHFIVDFGENMSIEIGKTMRELKRMAKNGT
jgi:ATP-dependent Clp protease ATP-binding subunit ClpA